MPETQMRDLAEARIPYWKKVELPRKIWHAGSICGVAWLAHIIEDYWVRVILSLFFFLLSFGFEWLRKQKDLPLVKLLQRENEMKGQRTTMVDFLGGLLLGCLFFDQWVLVVALVVTALCDPMAALIGQSLKNPYRWPGSKKSFFGTLACAGTGSVVVLSMMPTMPFAGWLGIGVVSGAAELFARQHAIKQGRFKGVLTPADNFYILVSTGVALTIAITLQKNGGLAI